MQVTQISLHPTYSLTDVRRFKLETSASMESLTIGTYLHPAFVRSLHLPASQYALLHRLG